MEALKVKFAHSVRLIVVMIDGSVELYGMSKLSCVYYIVYAVLTVDYS